MYRKKTLLNTLFPVQDPYLLATPGASANSVSWSGGPDMSVLSTETM